MVNLFTCLTLLALSAAAGTADAQTAQGQPKAITKQNTVTAVVTIKAIDPATRSVTLQSANGDEDTFTAGPEVKRFNELKVGDKIRATYAEALVFQVRKPGTPSTQSTDTLAAGRLKETPGGAVGVQQTRTVTVKAVDMNVPSITVVTEDGRTMTRKIAEKKNLEGVSPGDRIEITYSQAVVLNAEPGK
jgi:Cu/Ag efflux protein CusF